MTHLSVNINKVATLRNARGEDRPNVQDFSLECERLGANGITIHPRPDERHIKHEDVFKLRPIVRSEFNIEGYPSDDFVTLVLKVKPEQVTLVPDAPDALTSSAGWDVGANFEFLSSVVERFLYTKPYADGYAKDAAAAVAPFVEAAKVAHSVGLGINAGHDLNLDNLAYFHAHMPYLDEVSIGHALISDALYLGLAETIRRYKQCLG